MGSGRKTSSEYPGWFLWVWEHFAFLFIGIGVLLLAVTIGLVAYLDYRIDQVEHRIQYVPPSSYTPPDLSAYAANDVDPAQLPTQQRVYVPVYSHVYYAGGVPYSLETTLSIRNSDTERPVYLRAVDYFDTSGELVKHHLDQPIQLKPLQTIEFLVERQDSSGGSGANFLVDWSGVAQLNRPVIQTVTVGNMGTQGIAFVCTGVETNGGD